MKARRCDDCVHFLAATDPKIMTEPICMLEFHFCSAFDWAWFQPTRYYPKPNTRCPHYRESAGITWPEKEKA